ncbi:hypothetical protein BDZ45DRAFT_594459 [Acephala macrosclerotiorum]|nr:hypothetical protein BDZ45DRAFT_594459 [Acephala macrosclerotiorum]
MSFCSVELLLGNSCTLKHLRTSSGILRAPGSLEVLSLLATIRDAICLVKGVGERYLWIDALCIIQDDLVSEQV